MATGSLISVVLCTDETERTAAHVFPVQPPRGGRAVRHPVQRKVVQHFVLRRRLLRIRTELPLGKAWMPQQECRMEGRRVRSAVADRLRARTQHASGRHCRPAWQTHQSLVGRSLFFGQSSRRGRARQRVLPRPPAVSSPAGKCEHRASQRARGAPLRWSQTRPSRRPARRSACTRGDS